MRTIKQTLALLALVATLCSCGALLGMESDVLMRIQKGMTQEEVFSILGKPMYRNFDREMEGWQYEKGIAGHPGITVIAISFVDGLVVNLDSYEKYSAPPVAVYPSVEIGGESVSRPHPGRGMNDRDFQAFYNKVKSKTFNDDKLNLIESGIGNRGLSCRQCIQMMSVFKFDDEKLEALAILAPNLTDRENCDKIVDSLTFISSEEKARRILGIKR